jgi:hypothetical protein
MSRSEPRFQVGDRVVLRNGSRGRVWRVVGFEPRRPWETETAYRLESPERFRCASESALEPASFERVAVGVPRSSWCRKRKHWACRGGAAHAGPGSCRCDCHGREPAEATA